MNNNQIENEVMFMEVTKEQIINRIKIEYELNPNPESLYTRMYNKLLNKEWSKTEIDIVKDIKNIIEYYIEFLFNI